MSRFLPCAALLALASTIPAAAPPTPAPEPDITWKKIVLDDHFRSEGVAIADVNKDGKTDVLNGEYWYEAPNWTPHEMQTPVDFKDGLGNYSRVFCCWAEDLNGDGYPDLIVIAFPGDPCYWLENPKGKATTADGKPQHWTKHTIWHSACNETPQYADLFGTGKRVLIMGYQPPGKSNEGQMAYFTPGADPTALWEMHPLSEPSTPPTMKDGKPVPNTAREIPGTQRFSHGLGVGDINGDGRADVMCAGGWWEQPEKPDGKTPWKFHPANLGPDCSDMFVYDVDGDGKADVISASAHKYGIWWHRQHGTDRLGNPTFELKEIQPKLVSETHAVHFVDIDGDGRPDIVTGKRWWSHGKNEPGASEPAAIYWLRNTRGTDGVAQFTPKLIDNDSGIGTQFAVGDINGDGLLDIISSNKKGVRIILQQRK